MSHYQSPGVYIQETDYSFYVKQISTSACGMVGVSERGPINQIELVTSWEQFVQKYGSYTPAGYLAYAARAFFDNGGRVLYVNRVGHLADPTDRDSLTAMRAACVLRGRLSISATIQFGTEGDNQISVEANETGATGNDISLELASAGPDAALGIGVQEMAITVNLATDANGDSTTTATQASDALNDDPDAASLVTAESMDLGIVTVQPPTHLGGGLDPTEVLRVSAIGEGAWGNELAVEIRDRAEEPSSSFDLIVLHRGKRVEVFENLNNAVNHTRHPTRIINNTSTFITVESGAVGNDDFDNRPQPGLSQLMGGEDGLDGLVDVDYIGEPSQHTGFYAFEAIADLNLLAAPGITTAATLHAGIAYAEQRKDLLFLAETPMFLEPLEAVDFREGRGIYSHTAFNSSFAALYYPWLTIQDPVTGQPMQIPPTGAIAGCIARSDQKAAVWAAPAGIQRGRIFNLIGLSQNASQGERDVLYAAGINVIADFPVDGIHIWGQKTLVSQASALDRINARRLLIYVEEAIGASSRFVVFEPNHPQTWRALIRLIDPFLREIRDKGGLYAYRIQCDEETNPPAVIDRNQMVARVFLQPTKTAEFVELNFVLTQTGANFEEIFGA